MASFRVTIQKMKKTTLKNGLTLIEEKKESDSVSIVITVKTGSNNESKKIFGISHFIEHMLFEGTVNRANSTIIGNEIERLGGDLNAYTSNERTCFYVKAPRKHFDKALGLLADIIQNPLFEKKTIEKERGIILKEINLVDDEPRFYQWILFHKTLFKKHPAKNPGYGTRETVRKIKRKELLSYYNKFYMPNNIIVSVVGNVSGAKSKVERAFGFKAGKLVAVEHVKEPKQSKAVRKERRKILSSYLVLGYKTINRREKDSYVLDVIKALLGRGQSGKIIEEIRNKRGLAYEVNVLHETEINYGYFAVYLNTDKKNIPLTIKIILDIFKKIKNTTNKEISEAKGFIEGQYILENEDTRELADELAFWQQVGSVNLQKDYIKNIRKVAKKDIVRVAEKYLTDNYALAVVEQS